MLSLKNNFAFVSFKSLSFATLTNLLLYKVENILLTLKHCIEMENIIYEKNNSNGILDNEMAIT